LSYVALAAGIAGLVTHLLVPVVTRVAVLLRAIDHPEPGGRKLQPAPVPRLGGIAILTGIVAGTGSIAAVEWSRLGAHADRSDVLALIVGTLLVFLVGVIDDLIGVSAAKKFLIQTVAAVLLVSVGWSFQVVQLFGLGEVQLGLFNSLVSVLWIVGVTNAINLLDGLDGLAGGVVAIIATSLLVFGVLQDQGGTVLLMGATVGACLGFLRHNWEPAKIFMGDSGSLTLGFLLAAVSGHSALKTPATVAILVPILALGIPVMDTLLVMAVRFLRRTKMPLSGRFLRMFHADRSHLHHLMGHLAASRKRVVKAIYAVVLIFCLAGILVASRRDPVLGIAMALSQFLVVFFIRWRGAVAQERQSQERHPSQLHLKIADDSEDGPIAKAG
jgi:UDP-GlcNAc:undecaprenyl-phosphate GlcNAc-1-phosphate transferase